MQDPMKAESIGMPSSGVPGSSSMYSSAFSIERRRFLSASFAGSGTTPSIPVSCCGLVPQVTCGTIAAQSMAISLSKAASASVGSVRQWASARSHISPRGANGRP